MTLLKQSVSRAFHRAFDLLRGVDLFELQNVLAACQERLESPMRIAIVGEICASKSTLVNAMLGESEVVRTGEMEETFNVSWLRYGPTDAPVTVHYKDPEDRTEQVERSQWAQWANRLGRDKLSEAVAYIEVPHDSLVLQTFHLIDTPGLNSYYGVDSRNTVDFLTRFSPDAIVVLFSQSIAQRTMDIIRSFQGPLFQNMSPINAVGVLTKIDTYWPGDPVPLQTGWRIAGRLMRDEASVQKAFFKLYPVCALLAVGAGGLSGEDIAALEILSAVPSSVYENMFKSARRFLKEDSAIGVPVKQREELLDKLSMYGVFRATEILRESPDIEESALRESLTSESGFDVFFRDIREHFGNRAFLIKLSSVLSTIQREAQRCVTTLDGQKAGLAREIANAFAEIPLHHQAFKELELLKRLFNGDLSLSEGEREEVLRVTGEYGTSCRERLGVPREVPIEEMRKCAEARSAHWNGQLSRSIDLSQRDMARVLRASYREIASHIDDAVARRLMADRELYGEEKS